MKGKTKRRRVVFERDTDGWWVAWVPGVPGCHTQGRTLAQARERIKEALAVSLDKEELPDLVETIRFPKDVDHVLSSFREIRADAENALVRAKAVTRRAAVVLTAKWGVSLRDAADILGLSHQRVAQLIESGGTRRRARA